MYRLRNVRNESDGKILAMISKKEMLEIISDIIYDEDKSVNDRMKAADFLMKYHFSKEEAEADKVVIIDDIYKKAAGKRQSTEGGASAVD